MQSTIINEECPKQKGMVSLEAVQAARMLRNSGQIILQGAPGCGKTYFTTELAVYMCDGEVPATRPLLKQRYRELQHEGRIGFTTFHQSLDYEEFVEGLKPDTDSIATDGNMRFKVRSGIFKKMCTAAGAYNDSVDNRPYILIIDEINRANVSKVLGELITLLEKSKRLGAEDEFTVTLPYSGDDFGVPDNLYIIGTMNTADRSLGYIDYAVRRRFAFMTLEAQSYAIREYYNDRGELMDKEMKLFTDIRNLIKNNLNPDFDLKDIMVGHSYFLAKTEEDYDINLDYKIRPLLEEYLRDGIIIDNGEMKTAIVNIGK